MNLPRCFSFTAAFVALVTVSSAQYTLIETAGTFRTDDTNFATGGTAFSSGEIGVAPHSTANLNNGTYGNSSSWIGNGASSAGIVFGSAANLSSFAFGRDNTGTYADRNAGTYNFYYTTDSGLNTGNALSASWTSLGSLTYSGSSPASPALRHLYNLSSTISNATGFRIDSAAGTAIDEIELYSTQVQAPRFSNLHIATGGYYALPVNNHMAVPFHTDSSSSQFLITGATVNAYTDTAATGFAISIMTNSGSNTPDQVVGTFSGPDSVGAGNLVYTSDGILVDANASYWLAWTYTGGSYLASLAGNTQSTGDWSTSTHFMRSLDGGATWSAFPNAWAQFSVTATAVPEPSTYAAIFGACALGLALWRRKTQK